MRKFAIREVETVKTTAALYGCAACTFRCGGGPIGFPPPID